MFKALNTSRSGKLSLDEFYEIFEVCDLKWKARPHSSFFAIFTLDKTKVISEQFYISYTFAHCFDISINN